MVIPRSAHIAPVGMLWNDLDAPLCPSKSIQCTKFHSSKGALRLTKDKDIRCICNGWQRSAVVMGQRGVVHENRSKLYFDFEAYRFESPHEDERDRVVVDSPGLRHQNKHRLTLHRWQTFINRNRLQLQLNVSAAVSLIVEIIACLAFRFARDDNKKWHLIEWLPRKQSSQFAVIATKWMRPWIEQWTNSRFSHPNRPVSPTLTSVSSRIVPQPLNGSSLLNYELKFDRFETEFIPMFCKLKPPAIESHRQFVKHASRPSSRTVFISFDELSHKNTALFPIPNGLMFRCYFVSFEPTHLQRTHRFRCVRKPGSE